MADKYDSFLAAVFFLALVFLARRIKAARAAPGAATSAATIAWVCRSRIRCLVVALPYKPGGLVLRLVFGGMCGAWLEAVPTLESDGVSTAHSSLPSSDGEDIDHAPCVMSLRAGGLAESRM